MNYSELSKEVSYALRHAPWEYELEMDESGGVPLEQLLFSLHQTSKWEDVAKEDLIEMIERSEKSGMKFMMIKSEHFMDILYQ